MPSRPSLQATPARSTHAPRARDARRAMDRASRDGTRELPFAAQIQRSFGHHDIGGLRAHLGRRATLASLSLSANAATRGDRIAFAGRPSLRTAAHEAAHAVQQRAGTAPASGLGRTGDRWERHADAVADRVASGSSAAELLDAVPSTPGAAHDAPRSDAVQLSAFLPATAPGPANSPLVTLVDVVGQYFPLQADNYPIHRGQEVSGWKFEDATDPSSTINSTRTTDQHAEIKGKRPTNTVRDGEITQMGYIGEFERALNGRQPTKDAMYAGGHLVGLAIIGNLPGVNLAPNLAPQEHSHFNNSSYKFFVESTVLRPDSGIARDTTKPLKTGAATKAEQVPVDMKVHLTYPAGYAKTWGELSDMHLIPLVINERLRNNVVHFDARIPKTWDAVLEIKNAADVASGWMFAEKDIVAKQNPRVKPAAGALVRTQSFENIVESVTPISGTGDKLLGTTKREVKFSQNIIRSGPSTRSKASEYRAQTPSADALHDVFSSSLKADDIFLKPFNAVNSEAAFLDVFNNAIDINAALYTQAFGSQVDFEKQMKLVFAKFDSENQKVPSLKKSAPKKKKKAPPPKVLTSAEKKTVLTNLDTALTTVAASDSKKRAFLHGLETVVDTTSTGGGRSLKRIKI